MAGLPVAPSSGGAQTVAGQARAVQASVVGVNGLDTTVLADTGTLSGATDARDASAASGAVPSVVTTGVLHAAAVASAEQVMSEASAADLKITVAGMTIGADFVMARARATSTAAPAAPTAEITGLTIDGSPVTVSGTPNQTIPLGAGRIVINEQQTSPRSNSVTALRVVIDGVADVVVAAASASLDR